MHVVCQCRIEIHQSGLSESFEVDGWVVKVSGQAWGVLFKKRRPYPVYCIPKNPIAVISIQGRPSKIITGV